MPRRKAPFARAGTIQRRPASTEETGRQSFSVVSLRAALYFKPSFLAIFEGMAFLLMRMFIVL